MRRFLIIMFLLLLPTYAMKLSVGGSHLIGIHYEFEMSENSIIDMGLGMFELGTAIYSASHQFLFSLCGRSDLYIGYGAMALTIPSIGAYLVAVKVPIGWRYILDSGNILTLGLDVNYVLGYTDDSGHWSSEMNIDPPILPFPFIAYSF